MTPRPLAVGPVLVFISLSVVTLVFWPTFRDLLAIGAPQEEYTHRIFVIPIFLVTVWSLRFELATLPIHAFWPGLLGIAGAGLLWLAGELTFIRLFTETAVIAMVPLVALAVFGYRWLWALSFPLFFLLFAVPVRGPLIDLQVGLTAKFTYWGLVATGVPVHREGPYFELPTGKWSIAEACSGIEYLSACMMLAVLYAWTMFTSTRKRVLFVAGAILVGISGNWLRAYLTITIAHLSDNRFLRNGHGTFGWIMFAALLFIYCWIGWHFRDRESSDAHNLDNKRALLERRAMPSTSGLKLVAVSGITLATLVIWPLFSHSFARHSQSRPIAISGISPEMGWARVEGTTVDWAPTLINPTVKGVQSFEKSGRRVDVFIGVFANQTWTSKLVTSVNQFIASASDRWTLVDRATTRATYLEKPLQVKTGVILGGAVRIMARQWYWIHGVNTGNDLQAKLEQLRARLSGGDDISAWITIYTVVDASPESAVGTLNEFMRDMGLPLERALVRTTQR